MSSASLFFAPCSLQPRKRVDLAAAPQSRHEKRRHLLCTFADETAAPRALSSSAVPFRLSCVAELLQSILDDAYLKEASEGKDPSKPVSATLNQLRCGNSARVIAPASAPRPPSTTASHHPTRQTTPTVLTTLVSLKHNAHGNKGCPDIAKGSRTSFHPLALCRQLRRIEEPRPAQGGRRHRRHCRGAAPVRRRRLHRCLGPEHVVRPQTSRYHA